MLILMPHATPKLTGVEGQTPSKEELDPLKAFPQPWKAVPPATPRASILPSVWGSESAEGEDRDDLERAAIGRPAS